LDAVPKSQGIQDAMAGDREKILAAGATDYIEKPINPATFIDQIAIYFPKQEVP
jgi:CheY-like chemotaxis protein